jgi:hypothetical protein
MKYDSQRLAAISAAIVSLTMLIAGCDSSSSSGPDMDEMAARLNPPKPAPEQPPAPVAAAPVPQPAPPQPQTSATALPGGIVTSTDPDDLAARPHVPAVSRGAGDVVGKRQYVNSDHGPLRYYAAVASARNFMEDRILDDQIQKTMQLYVAGNDGKYPKTNEEFMQHIISEGMIQLPELPPGKEYFYDPADHELKVGTLGEPPADGSAPAGAQPPATPAPGTPAPPTPAPAGGQPAAP